MREVVMLEDNSTAVIEKWSEEDHPRGDAGRFADTGSSAGSPHGQWDVERDDEGPTNAVTSASPEAPVAAFVAAIRPHLPEGVTLRGWKWRTPGASITGGMRIKAVRLNSPGGGFADVVIYRTREGLNGPYRFSFQQHDVGLPAGERGRGLGGRMIGALVQGFRAVGVTVPIHVNVNPGFWDHMRERYPGVWRGFVNDVVEHH